MSNKVESQELIPDDSVNKTAGEGAEILSVKQ